MVFLLIIFFLTATTFSQKEREHDVLLPATRGAGSLSKTFERNLIVNVRKGGEILVAGRQLTEPELQSLVADKNARSSGTLKVKVRADRRAPYGFVARVLAAVERAGVARPYIDTKQEELEP
jgi:biopolymer transport protein ExbD